MGLNPPLLHAFVRFNGQGTAEMGYSELGRGLGELCLTSPICHSTAEVDPEEGPGTDFGVEALAKALQVAEPSKQPCQGMRREQGRLPLGHSCLLHRGCVGEQCGSRADVTEVSSVIDFK